MIIRENFNLNKFGKLLDKNWVLKKKLSESISNTKIDYSQKSSSIVIIKNFYSSKVRYTIIFQNFINLHDLVQLV